MAYLKWNWWVSEMLGLEILRNRWLFTCISITFMPKITCSSKKWCYLETYLSVHWTCPSCTWFLHWATLGTHHTWSGCSGQAPFWTWWSLGSFGAGCSRLLEGFWIRHHLPWLLVHIPNQVGFQSTSADFHHDERIKTSLDPPKTLL